ncbi:anoctamin-8 isoform X2 [Contarinia nasturtii]|uniref:anoctamin-8 isoform X2 n=1 Tax=Contarinia nasturtii TaxID=265458 RepID=UPI0012D4B39E|nr:anoctamin-8 isoform X2 [Contarinia nasturtii]
MNMLDPVTNEIIYASNGCDEIHESEDTGTEYVNDDNNLESNIRRRKGKIISCAKETIEQASRQIRRRLPYAGHLMTPRRLWLNKIPTLCDVVIEFPGDAPDEALRWLLSRIRAQPPIGLGLQTTVKAHESTKRTAFYVSAPTNILYKAAEEARLPKRLRSDLGGTLREFTSRECHCFAQIKNQDGTAALFTSQERQWLVTVVLQGLRAGTNDLTVLQGRAGVEEGQSIIAAWQQSGLIYQIFPLHETSALNSLQLNWVRKLFSAQPLDDIAEYFGVKVALYFAWLGHYTCALGVPAIFGTILWAALYNSGQVAQDIGHVIFSLFNVAWASLYLEAWRRYSVELAFRWGTLSTPPDLLEPPRPLYKGKLEVSSVTGRLEPKEAPAWQRLAFRYLVSFPIIGLCLALVFAVMFVMLQLQDWADAKLPEKGLFSCLSVIPKVLLAGAITLMDEAYFKLAVWLNDRENYRLQSKYENHLIAKVALFQFVNSFLSLFYIAFYLRDQDKLKEQLAGLLISRQIIGNLRESVFPYFMEQLKLAKLSFVMWGALSPTQETAEPISTDTKKNDDIKETNNTSTSTPGSGTPKRTIGQAEIESSYYKYDGTFSDHLEMLVQMGYVVLFSAAFPLAGVCALANNLLEIRSDAFKLVHVHQRPFGQRVANIGTWQTALSFLSLAAVIVNCALIGLSGQVSRLWPGLTAAQTIILIVALEHVMLGLRSALTWILPELPTWLAAEIARAEHCRHEMQVKGTSPRQTPPTPLSTASVSRPNDDQEDTPPDTELNYPLDEEITFTPISPRMAYNDRDIINLNIEADVCINEAINKEFTPDSPVVQQLHKPSFESNTRVSMQNLRLEIPPYAGACKNCKQIMKFEMPPFIKFGGNRNAKMHALPTGPSTSASFRVSSQPMKILEIPPYRKNQLNQNPTAIVNPSPPRIPEIPAFKTRKSNDWQPTPMDNSNQEFQQLHIPAPLNSDLVRRLKNSESTVHRSHDCIVAGSKDENITKVDSAMKVAPSWTNVAQRSESISSTTGAVQSIGSKKSSIDDETKGQKRQTLNTKRKRRLKCRRNTNDSNDSKTSVYTKPNRSFVELFCLGRVKAAELAAKKSRVKQSLIKRARSVAIFSLKLKERRAREAEKQAYNLAEQEKVLNPQPPGGELDLIGIEQLIQIDDLQNNK